MGSSWTEQQIVNEIPRLYNEMKFSQMYNILYILISMARSYFNKKI